MATWILLLSITSLATSAPNSASIEDIMETFTEQTARIAELTKEINDLKSLNSEQKTRITSLEKQTEELQAEKEIRTDKSKKLVYFAKEVMKATEVVMTKFGGLSDEFEVSDLFGELRSILPSGSSVSRGNLEIIHMKFSSFLVYFFFFKKENGNVLKVQISPISIRTALLRIMLQT